MPLERGGRADKMGNRVRELSRKLLLPTKICIRYAKKRKEK